MSMDALSRSAWPRANSKQSPWRSGRVLDALSADARGRSSVLAIRWEAEGRVVAGDTEGDGGAGVGEEGAQSHTARGRGEDGQEEGLGVTDLGVGQHARLGLGVERAMHGHGTALPRLKRGPAADRGAPSVGLPQLAIHPQRYGRRAAQSDCPATEIIGTIKLCKKSQFVNTVQYHHISLILFLF